MASEYAHPIERIVSYSSPMAIPEMILRSHIVSFWIFVVSVLVETTTGHSGYDFFARVAKIHDLRHEKFTINYGTVGILDWFLGTDELKRRSE